MEELFIEINNRINSQQMKLAHVSNLSDVSVSSISRFLNQTSRELEIDAVERILKVVAPDLRARFMKRYLLKVKRPKNLRLALEFASTHRWLNIFKNLIDKCLEDRNPEVSEAASIYLLLYKWQTDEISANELYNVTRYKKALFQEGKNLLRILETYALCELKHFDFMVTSIGDTEKSIDMMDEGYFKQTYKARISEIMMIINVRYYTNPSKVREYGKVILNSPVSSVAKGNVFFLMGQSYLFTDIDKLNKYYDKAIVIFEKFNRISSLESVKMNKQFANIMWKKDKVFHFTSTESELLYSYKNNNQEHINKILNTIDPLQSEPAIKYLIGLIKKDRKLLLDSLISYKSNGDRFHAELPKKALIELGEEEYLLNLILDK